jgi:hypothetical protein
MTSKSHHLHCLKFLLTLDHRTRMYLRNYKFQSPYFMGKYEASIFPWQLAQVRQSQEWDQDIRERLSKKREWHRQKDCMRVSFGNLYATFRGFTVRCLMELFFKKWLRKVRSLCVCVCVCVCARACAGDWT